MRKLFSPTIRVWFFLACLVSFGASSAIAAPSSAESSLRSDVRQIVVSIAPSWSSNTGSLLCLQRQGDGSWKPALAPIAVLFGRNGLAWGRGVLDDKRSELRKIEKDGRAPAGVFKIGKIYTHDDALPEGSDYPFHTITKADAWIDDPTLPEYNRFVQVDLNRPPEWFDRQRMRHNDFAYRWLVEVRHNADPPVKGKGSAIFFHIRRGVNRPTAGCTTMAEADLASVIRWLRADAKPHYVLLPWDEYQARWEGWSLPNPAILKNIAPK